MEQFDVFPNPSPRSKAHAPYVIVLQSDWMPDGLRTVVVAPLVPRATRGELEGLMVAVIVEDAAYWISLPEIANIRRSSLRGKIVNLAVHSGDIIRALDRIFTGL